jgi:hypothetical protein
VVAEDVEAGLAVVAAHARRPTTPIGIEAGKMWTTEWFRRRRRNWFSSCINGVEFGVDHNRRGLVPIGHVGLAAGDDGAAGAAAEEKKELVRSTAELIPTAVIP